MNKDEALRLALEVLADLGMKHYENTGEVLYKNTYTAIKAALEAKDEPVAQPEVRTGNCLRVGVCASEGHKIQPQRKPLTDEEIYTEARNHEKFAKDGREWFDRGTFARAIEAAHGIKEEA